MRSALRDAIDRAHKKADALLGEQAVLQQKQEKVVTSLEDQAKDLGEELLDVQVNDLPFTIF